MSGIFDENFFECGKLTRVCVFCDFGKKSEIFCQSKPRSILKANVCQFAICLSNHRSSQAKNQKHCVCFVVGLWRGLWKSKKYSSKIPDSNNANGDIESAPRSAVLVLGRFDKQRELRNPSAGSVRHFKFFVILSRLSSCAQMIVTQCGWVFFSAKSPIISPGEAAEPRRSASL